MNTTVLILAVAGAFAIASVVSVNAQSSDPGGGVPRSAFFVGGGASYSSVSFGIQSVYNKGTSDAFINDALAASGEADDYLLPPISTATLLPWCNLDTSSMSVAAIGYGAPSFHTAI